LRNVSVAFGDRVVLRNVSAVFASGVHVVLGRNGSGKTTLLRTIAGLVKYSGEVLIYGVDIRKYSRRELSKLVGYVWQNPYYGFIEASVKAEIEAILKTLNIRGDWSLVDILVPKHLLSRDPFTLSGGEAKRVSLASILVADQPIWLLDEPFTNLDRDGVLAVLEVINRGRARGKTIIVALHEVFYAKLLNPDTYLILDSGAVIEYGAWSRVDDDVLKRAGLIPLGEVCAGRSS